MKKLLLFFVLAFTVVITANAQAKKILSPKDSVEVKTNSGVDIKIVYSRPSLRNRDITSIVPFDKVWRTGANAATIFQVDQDVTINGNALPAGEYSLYTIPGEKNTTLIFNKIWKQSGLEYDSTADVFRTDVPTKMVKNKLEQFTIQISKKGEVALLWSNWDIRFKVKK